MYINDISLKKAEWFATLSALAYKNKETHRQFFQSEGIGIFKSLDEDGTQAIMYCNAGEIGVVFRGTEPTEFKDILADLDIRKKLLYDYDIEIGGGLGPFAGKVWRVGLMGYSAYEKNVDSLVNALKKLI